MRQAYFDFVLLRRKFTQPCTSLTNINYKYEETDLETTGGKFKVWVFLPETFKEILQVQAVDFHSLIGNSGGYIGLFCGKNYVFSFNRHT